MGWLESTQQSTPSVVLQVGEFYETYGIDAVLMVQWAGLNPMGRASRLSPPRAGEHHTIWNELENYSSRSEKHNRNGSGISTCEQVSITSSGRK